MRAVIQRVTRASVTIDGQINGSIGKGLLVFLGIEDADAISDVEWLSGKICSLRIFNDEAGVMNLSLQDISGEVLLVSQFTLHASTRKGNRPSYIRASKPPHAVPLYEAMIVALENQLGRKPATGVFGADMQVELNNDGPVTIWIDSQNRE
jgi:D-tyrosyl-tRNA(Tyr) deacylase